MTAAGQALAMDRMYRYQRHVYDISRRYYLLGRATLIDRLRPPPGASILEFGCGTGWNLAAAARHYPNCRIYGCDISAEMLKSTRAKLDRAGLSERVRVALGDATDFQPGRYFDRARFDRIYFSYTLSMIPAWTTSIGHALDLLTPGGQLHVLDFGSCDGLPPAFRPALYAWLALFSVHPREGLSEFLASAAATGHHDITATPLYRGYAIHATVETH